MEEVGVGVRRFDPGDMESQTSVLGLWATHLVRCEASVGKQRVCGACGGFCSGLEFSWFLRSLACTRMLHLFCMLSTCIPSCQYYLER